jgi:hypothetical protein
MGTKFIGNGQQKADRKLADWAGATKKGAPDQPSLIT